MKKISFLVCVIIFQYLSDVCYSATLSIYENEANALMDYRSATEKRSFPVRLLKYDLKTKIDMCNNFIGSTYFKKKKIIHIDTSNKDLIKKLTENYVGFADYIKEQTDTKKKNFVPYEVDVSEFDISNTNVVEVFFTCPSVTLVNESTFVSVTLIIVYAFEDKYFFISEIKDGDSSDSKKKMKIEAFVEADPDYHEDWTQARLENFFVDVYKMIDKLREAAPNVVRTMESYSPIKLLKEDNVGLLCSSVFNSNYYRKKSVEYDEGNNNMDKTYDLVNVELKFELEKFFSENITGSGIICDVIEDKIPKKYALIITYIMNKSVFVVKNTNNGKWILDQYMFNISSAILSTVSLSSRGPSHYSFDESEHSNVYSDVEEGLKGLNLEEGASSSKPLTGSISSERTN